MKKTAIIYCRKSTDREDLQQNSLEHQINNCKNTAKINNIVVLDEVVESASAKTGSKRAWFSRMITDCEKGKVDYIIVDAPNRISRNIHDISLIIELLDKNKLKWVFTTEKFIDAQNSSAKFFLLFELWFAKKDNEDRSKDVKAKMITALNKWQWLGKAIFWYKNTWTKWKKDVKVIQEEAKIVRQAFIMRSKSHTLQEIANFINEKALVNWKPERVSKMLTNTKYYWLQKFWWQEALFDSPWYQPIISKELFDKVNKITKAVRYDKNKDLPRCFTNILKDTQWNNLYPYKTKWNIYYHHWAKTPYKINISQKKLFEEFEKHISNYNFPKPLVALSKATLKEYYKDKVNNRKADLKRNTKELNKTKNKLESLFDKFLENEIDKKTYDIYKEKLEKQKIELEEEQKALKQWDDNIIEIIENLCELVENLSETYKNWNDEKKWKIIKAMQCELILNSKKSLP